MRQPSEVCLVAFNLHLHGPNLSAPAGYTECKWALHWSKAGIHGRSAKNIEQPRIHLAKTAWLTAETQLEPWSLQLPLHPHGNLVSDNRQLRCYCQV